MLNCVRGVSDTFRWIVRLMSCVSLRGGASQSLLVFPSQEGGGVAGAGFWSEV